MNDASATNSWQTFKCENKKKPNVISTDDLMMISCFHGLWDDDHVETLCGAKPDRERGQVVADLKRVCQLLSRDVAHPEEHGQCYGHVQAHEQGEVSLCAFLSGHLRVRKGAARSAKLYQYIKDIANLYTIPRK